MKSLKIPWRVSYYMSMNTVELLFCPNYCLKIYLIVCTRGIIIHLILAITLDIIQFGKPSIQTESLSPIILIHRNIQVVYS